MSPFVPANIPPNVNTLEKLLVWVIFALCELNSNSFVQAASGTIEPVVSAQIVRLPNQEVDPERVVCVAYLPLLGTWRGLGKVWSTGIKELVQTALPASYTAN
jgi:hypothetical protein